MSYTIAPAAKAGLDQATALWPQRSKASDGTIGDTAHSSRKSDHNPDDRGIVMAFDLTHDPAHGCDAHAEARRVVARRDPRVKYVISNGEISNPLIEDWKWRPYSGSNPHTKHAHFSIKRGWENDTSEWYPSANTKPPTPTPTEEPAVIVVRFDPDKGGKGEMAAIGLESFLRQDIKAADAKYWMILIGGYDKVQQVDAAGWSFFMREFHNVDNIPVGSLAARRNEALLDALTSAVEKLPKTTGGDVQVDVSALAEGVVAAIGAALAK